MTTLVQKPPSTAWNPESVRDIAERLKSLDGPLLPILHAINGQFGYVDERALPIIAEVLNLTRAEVQGVVSFYHDFRRAPAGRHIVKICRAEACQAMGAERLITELETALGVKLGETSAEGRITLEPVYCLGNCALSPAALIDGRLYGRLDAARTLAQVGK
jgi:formate dehydrogenase subunit gamma